jgi:hypothetical protein
MLSRSDRSDGGYDEDADVGLESLASSRGDLHQEFTTIQDDVERLIHVAAQLFSAIERQIHDIESDLQPTVGEQIWQSERTIFKERLIQSAQDLEHSLQEITKHLGQRVFDSTGATGSPLELVR